MVTYYNDDLLAIKRRCKIDSSNTDFDTQLGEKLEQAYNYMNAILNTFVTTPLTPDQFIKDIEADMGAGLFLEEGDEPTTEDRTERHILWTRGYHMLDEYIQKNYKQTRRNPSTDCFSRVISATHWNDDVTV